jgi:hypothetical protein
MTIKRNLGVPSWINGKHNPEYCRRYASLSDVKEKNHKRNHESYVNDSEYRHKLFLLDYNTVIKKFPIKNPILERMSYKNYPKEQLGEPS